MSLSAPQVLCHIRSYFINIKTLLREVLLEIWILYEVIDDSKYRKSESRLIRNGEKKRLWRNEEVQSPPNNNDDSFHFWIIFNLAKYRFTHT